MRHLDRGPAIAALPKTAAKICLIDEFVPQTALSSEVARTDRFKKGSGMPISITAKADEVA